MTLAIYIYILYIIIYTLGLQTPSETVFGDAVWDLKDIIYIYVIWDIYYMTYSSPLPLKKIPMVCAPTQVENGDVVGICVSGGLDSKTVALRLRLAGVKAAMAGPWRGHGGAMAGPLGPWRSWGGVISPYSTDILGVIYKPGAAQKGLQIQKNHALLVGGFKHEFYFPFHIWDVILPID